MTDSENSDRHLILLEDIHAKADLLIEGLRHLIEQQKRIAIKLERIITKLDHFPYRIDRLEHPGH